jgi:sulfite dehydrogenase (cytochrome) subunit B
MRAALFLCAAAIIAATSVALAQESKLELKQGPGRDLVMGYCVMCHSVDYIASNSPFMTRQVWDAEVTKMIKAYGAQIPADDATKIVDYLTTNYGVATPPK